MKSYFAPAERKTDNELLEELRFVSTNPVITRMLTSVGGTLAVLNQERQILAVNDELLKRLGVEDAATLFGLRPGEAIQCVHANEQAGGCGTGKFCSTCGAAIAIVAAVNNDEPLERDCVVTVKRDGSLIDQYLKVRSCPFVYEGYRFVLLFLHDTTHHQRRAMMERVFFHDINNLIFSLNGIIDLFEMGEQDDLNEIINRTKVLLIRLVKEIDVQKVLSDAESHDYTPAVTETNLHEVMEEIDAFFANHPLAQGKSLQLPDDIGNLKIATDPNLLLRILTNMLTNAFEATSKNGVIRLWLEWDGSSVSFHVWNEGVIPEDIRQRVFQRYFSTKRGNGRGYGTYSMKLFGERYLHGRIGFKTAIDNGTVFSLKLPREWQA